MAKIVVTLEVEVDPMTVEEQIEEYVDPEDAEEFEIGDDEAFQVADAIAAHLPNADDLLAGTNLMVHVRDATAISAELGA